MTPRKRPLYEGRSITVSAGPAPDDITWTHTIDYAGWADLIADLDLAHKRIEELECLMDQLKKKCDEAKQ